MSTITDNLNPAQLEAVTTEAPSTLVLAGAGSGKTRVLVHRISWLIQEKNISPFSILAVTFTNKAAAEMRGRIENMLHIPMHSMWIGTFHGMAHRLLRTHWQEAKLPQSFQILDSDDQYQQIRRIMRELSLDEEKWPPRQVQWFINQQKDAGRRPKDLNSSQDPFAKTMLTIYQEYEQRCQQAGLVDFAELLLRAYELWASQPQLLDHYQQRFSHILIDEFQDTNTIQYNWIKLLANKESNIMIVGDDDQSIYSWRGAQVENLTRFQKDFPNTKTIRLEQNYRSTSNILNAANAVISNNDDRMGKTLWTDTGEGDKIQIYHAFNDLDEAKFIACAIWDAARKGSSHQEFAILYRSNAQSRVIEEALLQLSIPYRVYGGLRFFERAEIKDALSYLHLMSNHLNDAAFHRIVNTPTRGIGETTLNTVREIAHRDHISLWEASEKIITEQTLSARACGALQKFIELITQMGEGTQSLELGELTEHVLHHSGLVEYYKNMKGEKSQVRVENLEELINATAEFEASDNPENLSPLASFLAHAALETGDAQADPTDDHVKLMTLHSAKGLEFPVVFLSGLEEGLFPHQMSLAEAHGLQEERRLCYVGMTRARKKLYCSHAEVRRLHGSETFRRPSRFLKEIPEELTHSFGNSVKISKPVMFQPAKKPKRSFIPTRDDGLHLGQLVSHPKFGNGLIINIEGEGEKTRLQIQFKKVGTKWLIAKFVQPVTA